MEVAKELKEKEDATLGPVERAGLGRCCRVRGEQ